MLEVRSLFKRYDDVVALDDVSLSVGRGELLGFLGPNGAGKTTTMRGILGVVSLDAGEVRWDGAPMTTEIRGRSSRTSSPSQVTSSRFVRPTR